MIFESVYWVTGFPYVMGVTKVLRDGLVDVVKARCSLVGNDEKTELNRFLSGYEFKQRVEMIVNTKENLL